MSKLFKIDSFFINAKKKNIQRTQIVESKCNERIDIMNDSDTKIYTLYSQEGDITFIMEDTSKTTSVVGFYYGEPDDEATQIYKGQLTAHFE